jgi:NitT/TauT family transport system permease protein
MVSSLVPASRSRVVRVARRPAWVPRGALLAIVLVAWQAWVSWSEFGGNPLLVASPLETAKAFGNGWVEGSLARSTWETLRVLLLGFGIGALLAAPFALLGALTRIGGEIVGLLASIMRPLPGVAALALALVWFGLSTEAIVVATANAAIWPLAIGVTTGFGRASPRLLDVGRSIGLSRFRLQTDVVAPAAMPHALAGLRTAWTSGWRTVVAAEFVFALAGGEGGLGAYLADARRDLLTPQLFAALVTIAALGVLFDVSFRVLERRTIVRWGMQSAPAD